MPLNITIVHGSILEVDVQAIVNAANSYGLMGGGVAGVIKRAAGQEVEDEAKKFAPIPIGTAVFTTGGRTKFLGIIHAPTMWEPAQKIPVEQVARATQAALVLADLRGLRSIAMPGMGTGVGRVSPDDAAQHMIREIRAFAATKLERVLLVDVDVLMVDAWRRRLAE
jgi:O-acetyl-ADP-ribose deacetylase (regulator of RNase III)